MEVETKCSTKPFRRLRRQSPSAFSAKSVVSIEGRDPYEDGRHPARVVEREAQSRLGVVPLLMGAVEDDPARDVRRGAEECVDLLGGHAEAERFRPGGGVRSRRRTIDHRTEESAKEAQEQQSPAWHGWNRLTVRSAFPTRRGIAPATPDAPAMPVPSRGCRPHVPPRRRWRRTCRPRS